MPTLDASDAEIVAHIRTWAKAWGECGLNADKANRIRDQELSPSEKVLQARGVGSLRKLIPLLHDESPGVRLIAASFAYAVAPIECRLTFEALMKEGGPMAMLAWTSFSHRDPAAAPPPSVLLGKSELRSMSECLNPEWSDERIVDYVRHWAIERGKCGLDGYAADRINTEHVFPAGRLLSDRGAGSVAKLLPLLNDASRDVRLAAASLAYEVDGPACRRIIEDLAKTLDMVGIMAWVTLSLKEGPDAVPNPGELWGIKE